MGISILWGIIATIVAFIAWLFGVSFWGAVLILFVTLNVEAAGFIAFHYLRGE